jgi:hypothetical protein
MDDISTRISTVESELRAIASSVPALATWEHVYKLREETNRQFVDLRIEINQQFIKLHCELIDRFSKLYCAMIERAGR